MTGIVKEWPGWFLRDDYDIRKDVKVFEGQEEAYSLFTFGADGWLERVKIFGGPLEWAIKEAEKIVYEDLKNPLDNGKSDGRIGV